MAASVVNFFQSSGMFCACFPNKSACFWHVFGMIYIFVAKTCQNHAETFAFEFSGPMHDFIFVAQNMPELCRYPIRLESWAWPVL